MENLFYIILASFIVSTSFANSVFANESLELEGGWVRAAPPSAKNLAGYGELKNSGSSNIEIISIDSPLFEKVEMHVTTLNNGMMRMKYLPSLVLAPNDAMLFEPGGRHFMLIKPKQSIKAGLMIPFKISLKSGKSYHFELKVRR